MENYSSCSLEILVPIANSSQKFRRIFRHLRDCKHLSVCMTFHSDHSVGNGNVIIPTDFQSIIFQDGYCTTKHLRGSPRFFPPKKFPKNLMWTKRPQIQWIGGKNLVRKAPYIYRLFHGNVLSLMGISKKKTIHWHIIWVNYNDLTATEPWKSWLVREIILTWP